MAKGNSMKKEVKEKGKEKVSKPPAKRGRKSGKEGMEDLFQEYSKTPCYVKSLIHGWEGHARAIQEEEEETAEEEIKHIITDPGHTRGRISLFHHSIRTYWLLKCLLVKAIMYVQEVGSDPKDATNLAEINRSVEEMNLRQHHQYVRLGRIKKELQSMHQVDIPGSSVKDLAPVESDDD